MKNSNYSLSDCEKLISKYIEIGGNVTIIEEGVLGLGTVICTAKDKKTTIIKEFFINSWQSGHNIIMYNKTPKKYLNY